MTPLPLAASAAPRAAGLRGRVRRSAFGFGRAWSRPRLAQSAPGARHRNAFLVLAAAMAVVVVSLVADVWIPQQARLLSPQTLALFRLVTLIGTDGYMWAAGLVVLAGAIAFHGARGWRVDAALDLVSARATYFLATMAVSGVIGQTLKHLFGRARPSLAGFVGPYHFDMISFTAKYASFPSGHSMSAFAAATALGCLAPRLRPVLFAVATFVGVSRLALYAHFPSDVVGGACLGAACALVMRRLFAARGLAFAMGAMGPRLRGRGRVWPVLRAGLGRSRHVA